MSLPTPPSSLSSLAAVPEVSGALWRLTVRQYHDMIDAGILGEDDPIELLDGLLVKKTPKHPPHRLATARILRALPGALPAGWHVQSQEPITLATSEPEPDIAVIRGSIDDYPNRHPAGSEVALVIEVADASLDRDRFLKRRIYAQAGISVYWLVILRDRQVEVFSQPAEGPEADYAAQTVLKAGQPLPVSLAGATVAALDPAVLLPD